MVEQSSLGFIPGFRSGFVAMVGRPNVGKSTLVNLLVGHKVSITSEKPQTTRHRIAGVLNGAGFQMVLLDMPGFQRPLDQLTRRMQDVVDAALTEVDAVLFLLNGEERIGRGDAFIAAAVARAATPVVVAINKADILSSERRDAAGGGGAGLGRPARASVDQCEDRLGCRRRARPPARVAARGPRLLPRGCRHRPERRGADRRTHPREGHPPDRGGGAALHRGPRARDGAPRGQRPDLRPGCHLRRTRFAETDPAGRGRQAHQADRQRGAPGDRGLAGLAHLPRSERTGAQALAARPRACWGVWGCRRVGNSSRGLLR